MSTLRRKAGFLVLTLSLLVSPLGCHRGPTRPEDLPELTPCTLTIMYKGSPLSDATVTLVPKSGNWVGVGQTDSGGQAVIQTNGRYAGVPAGSYAVTVTKGGPTSQLPPDPKTPEEDQAYREAMKAAKSARLLVPMKYTKTETSRLTVKVSDDPVSETLELTD
ncbi:MAG: carboxypeptidase-like regulatory domain-containing protein [Thermoguttaceae bacterium]